MTAAARRARKAGSEGGYSLIETLAAVFILALASGVAVATLPPGADPRETDARPSSSARARRRCSPAS